MIQAIIILTLFLTADLMLNAEDKEAMKTCKLTYSQDYCEKHLRK